MPAAPSISERAVASDLAANNETVVTPWHQLITSDQRAELITLWTAWKTGTDSTLMSNYPSARSLARFIRSELAISTKPTLDMIIRDLSTLMV